MDGEPFDSAKTRELIRSILEDGVLVFSKHAHEEMEKDDLLDVDARNVLRGGVVRFPEMVKGTWRYRVETRRIAVVVAFRSETELVVVTAWRF